MVLKCHPFIWSDVNSRHGPHQKIPIDAAHARKRPSKALSSQRRLMWRSVRGAAAEARRIAPQKARLRVKKPPSLVHSICVFNFIFYFHLMSIAIYSPSFANSCACFKAFARSGRACNNLSFPHHGRSSYLCRTAQEYLEGPVHLIAT